MSSVHLSMDVLENYANAVNEVDSVASSNLEQTLRNIDLRDEDMVLDLMHGACRAGAQASAGLAAQFYRGLSILQTGVDPDVKPLSSYDEKAVTVAVRAIYAKARKGDGELDEEYVMSGLLNRVGFDVNRASKVGVWRNGQRDSRDVRYARVPVGAETCAWCVMTAGLGYWFMSEEAASHTHAHCDCVIVAEIGGIHDVVIDGYDSTVYRDMWREANKALRYGDVPSSLSERVDFLAATTPGYRKDTNGALAVMRWKYGLK